MKFNVLALCASFVLVPAALAQNVNPFYGFDFLVQPLAFKWACGGAAEGDLEAIQGLMAQLPEEAERGGVQIYLDAIVGISQAEDAMTQLAGGALSETQEALICRAAAPLTIDWITPAHLTDNVDLPDDQRVLWARFYGTAQQILGGL